MKILFIAASLLPSNPLVSAQTYCDSHDDCGSQSPFCYEYSYSYYYSSYSGYCTDCSYCSWCWDGVDGSCGAGCGYTTYYGSQCSDYGGDSDSDSDTDYDYDGYNIFDYPTAEECEWVQTNINTDNQYYLGNNATMTMDECIVMAWNANCDIANYHNETQTCKCQFGDDETVQWGSEYQSCFLDEYRELSLAWLAHAFATMGAILVVIIVVPTCCCCCFWIAVCYCCCCRNNNQHQPVPQQPTQVVMVPQQPQMVGYKQPMQPMQAQPQYAQPMQQMPGGGQQHQYTY